MNQRTNTLLWKQLLQRSARSNLSLQGQIREMLVSAILDGLIEPGRPVPSGRELAEQLGVARNTVVLAYKQLADEGYLLSRQRSGHFVNAEFVAGLRAHGPGAEDSGAASAPIDWDSRLRLRPTRQRSIHKPADWQKYPYPFLYGQFDASLFPTANWRECCLKALSVLDIRDWAPDHINRDDETLVQQIRTRVLPRRGVWAQADEIVVTVGAQHALYMVADLLLGEHSTLALENPGYPDARNIFAARTSRLLPIDVDADGLPVDQRLHGADYLYVTPSHQCPTGVTMPLERRQSLLHWAERNDLIIIEDDFESENRFGGEPIPALKSLDHKHRVIYIGSLSKSWAPGLRLGYIVAPAPLAREFRALRRLMLRHPSTFVQRAFALFLSLGHHDAQLRRIAMAQQQRSQAVLRALAEHLPQCEVTPVIGGGSCWLRLPDGIDTIELARRAAEQGVLLESGDVFFFQQPAPGSFLRLGWQSIPDKAIEPGIALLGKTLQSL
ncbi:PLP-dependent aminotransferase family protein [Thiomonas sp. FB-6]|uniref:MocR-like pyridoxine biosynthesis transcription factor PdxR n=1 Tax=Thiomonas sp. FB-6 TaxID=1158291 RepID=UPI000379320F|nr:PLP-dependent aminotransferase family protein [Thiomonas sp. FB-6]